MAESKGTPPKVTTPEGVVANALDGISRQSQFSTIKPNNDLPETNPPAGKHVVEELGKASKSVKPAAS